MKTYTKYLEEAKPNKSIGKWGKWAAYVSGFKSLSKGGGSGGSGRALTLKDGSAINIDPETARVLYSYIDGPWLSKENKEKFAQILSRDKKGYNNMLKQAQKRIYG